MYNLNRCEITLNHLTYNDEILFSNPNFSKELFLKYLYNELNINYPKFYKMDNLSKLSILASEVLLKKNPLKDDRCGVIFMNKSSSLETDIKHYDTIKSKEFFYPSPANFVYTLPNICVGEVCIKNKLKGENIFFVAEAYNENFLIEYAKNLIETGDCNSVLGGWVESMDESFNVKLFKLD